MKLTTLATLCAIPFLLVTCATIPITGKLCYTKDGQMVCVASDGTAIQVEGHLTGDGKAVIK